MLRGSNIYGVYNKQTMSDFAVQMRQSLLKKTPKEPIFVNFPNGCCVIYALTESTYNPYCKHCLNSVIIQTDKVPFNQFGDKTSGTCDKCNIMYPLRYV